MFELSPHNDFGPSIAVRTLATDQQTAIPYEDTSGPTPIVFLATSKDADATAADAALVCAVTYVHVGGLYKLFLDATVLTTTLLDSLFLTTPPVLIIVVTNGSREYIEGIYVRERAASNG